MVPGVALYIMNTIVGLTEEMASMTLTPFKIFSFIAPLGELYRETQP